MGGVVLVACVSWDAVAATPEPAPTTQPSVAIAVRGRDGAVAARVMMDPRGVAQICTAAEPTFDWVIPRGDHAWDYREWQWWRGHPWGDEMRPRYWGQPALDAGQARKGRVEVTYEADGFAGRQRFVFRPVAQEGAVCWDVLTTIRNNTGEDVFDYGQFFACYTPVNHRKSFYYWDAKAGLRLLSDVGVEHLNGYVVSRDAWFAREGRIPHCPRGDGTVVATWRHPLLVSRASPGGWRHVLMVDEARCAAVTQGMEGNAMDYVLYPGPRSRRFAAGAAFTAHVRHCLIRSADLPGLERLAALWTAFENSK
jgi:hypothetical protein